MLLACDPRLLIYSEGEVRSALEMVKGWESEYERLKAGGKEGEAELNRRLWEAQVRIVCICIFHCNFCVNV